MELQLYAIQTPVIAATMTILAALSITGFVADRSLTLSAVFLVSLLMDNGVELQSRNLPGAWLWKFVLGRVRRLSLPIIAWVDRQSTAQ